MIKAVIFDFDDTLCLTEEGCFILENEIAMQMGHTPMSREMHLKTWGNPLGEAIKERIPGIDAEEFMRRLSVWQPIFAKEGRVDRLTSQNLAVLDKLRSYGKKLAIVTSRELHEVQHLLEDHHPLSARIQSFYHKDNSDFLKPDPRVFDKVLGDFGLRPEEAVYVGDAVTDAIAAKKAGLHFIALLESGIRKKEDFDELPVDLFASNLSEVIGYVLATP